MHSAKTREEPAMKTKKLMMLLAGAAMIAATAAAQADQVKVGIAASASP